MSETKGDALAGVRCSIDPSGGNYHFRLAGCDDCNVRDLGRRTLAKVEELYRTGYVDQDTYEAYMHVWATGAVRFSGIAEEWREPSIAPRVVALVALFREDLAKRKAVHA